VTAPATPVGIADMQSRIAAIQSRFGATPAVTVASISSDATSSSDSTSSTSDAFAASLASATATDDTTDPADDAPTGDDVLGIAKQYLGVPYKWGGTDPATGLDCSGFTQLVYSQAGVDLPRTSAQQSTVGTKVDSLADAQPGDLLFFGTPVDHVAIYEGDNKIIQAPHTGTVVSERTLNRTPVAIRRVLPDVDPNGSSAGTGVSTSGMAAALASSTGISQATWSRALSQLGSSNTSAVAAAAATLTSATSASSATAATASSTGVAILPQLTAYAGDVGNVPYAAEFTAAEKKYGVPATVLAAVAKQESGYRADAVSKAGAQGLMQLMPGTAAGLGVDATDPAQAVDGAARLLRDNVKTFGSLGTALAAYNAGGGAVRKYGGIPPYAETRTYVSRILATLEGTS
jgi:cell wall-associated NlpC family hydrolase